MRRSRWYPLLGLALIVAGVAGLLAMASLGSPAANWWTGPQSFVSNGQRIFLMGTGVEGPITYREGPFWLGMHGGGCATCHGADGRGGRPMMLDISAPDVRYSALTARGYDEGLIARAITAGLGSQGQPLDPAMPRWQMRAEEMAEVIAYLKTLR
ncbi:MAG: cytochrome c [Chloroflexi bacterium]|nr:cytochrome c [Chloroflexota bacterium]